MRRLERKMNRYFEHKIREYMCNFNLLDELIDNQTDASNYYAWVRSQYKLYLESADSKQKNKFYIRYYKAKKLLYSSAQMLIEAKKTIKMSCIVGYYYLIYYALFQAMQANVIFCIQYTDEKVLRLSHDNVKKYFDEQFCKNMKCPLDGKIITLLENLRSYREYYSYAMPFNLTDKASVNIEQVEYYIKICYQLLELHCYIVFQDVCNSINFDISCK